MQERRDRFLRFAIVGVVGFFVDATVVWSLVRVIGASPYLARIASYLAAATTTWRLNRTYTFQSIAPPGREYLSFMLGNLLGATANLGVFAAIIALFGSKGWLPVFAVGAGSMVGLCFNYMLSNRFVFSSRGVTSLPNGGTQRD